MKAYNRDKRNHNNIYKTLPMVIQQNIKRYVRVYTRLPYLKRLPTYEHVEDREPGKIYYHVPCYGYVELEDLRNLHCDGYKSKYNLNCFIDSIIYSASAQQVYIQWFVDGERCNND